MKKYLLIFAMSMLFVTINGQDADGAKTTPPEQQAIKGTVKANVLNVRVKPGLKYTAVAKLKRGDEVAIVKKNKDWYEIVLPASASTWIAAALVKDNKTISEAKLRSGPSISHEDYGMAIPAGTELTIQDKSKADWLKVAPPSTMTGWISCENILVAGENVQPKDNETTSPASTAKDKKSAANDTKDVKETKDTKEKKDIQDNKDSKTAKTAKNKESSSLPFVMGMDKEVNVEGVVASIKNQTTPYVSHALYKIINTKAVLYCYLHSAKGGLDPWNEKQVKIKGKLRMVRGWKTPVLEVEKISPAITQ